VRNRVSAAKRRVMFGVVAAVGLLATGCARQTFPQDPLHPEGPWADKIDRLWRIVFVPAAIIFFLVMFLVVYVAIRYRARSDDDAPVQTHGNIKLELTWTIIPFVLLLVIGVLTVQTVFEINTLPKKNVMPVTVTGHQWWWEFRYPTLGITTANELHIPTNKNINVTITSADVIHSFWPTELAGKVDAIPGRMNHLTLEAVHPGTYDGQCAEYCGLSHANMRLRVVAHSPSDFAAWARNQQKPATIPTGTSDEAVGAGLFKSKGCSGCHTINGYSAGQVGPNLTHLETRKVFAGAIFPLDDQHLTRWLRNPPAEKPMMPQNGLGMPNLKLTDQEIASLIAFLQTLH